MTDRTTLRTWLDSLDSAQLELVLERSPMAFRGAQVRDLDELAMRLEHPSSISQALMTAPAPVLQLVEAASALGEAATLDRLTELLDTNGTDPETHRANVEHWLGVAAASALAWSDGEQVHLNPGIDQVIVGPLALARPARVSLAEETTDELQQTLRAWEVKAPPRKADRLVAARRCFADPVALRRVVGTASEEVFTTLSTHVTKRLAASSTVASSDLTGDEDLEDEDYSTFDRHTYAAEKAMWQWAASVGLAFGYTGFGFVYEAELPTEVYLALAPPDFHVGFAAEAPAVATVPAPAEQVQRSYAGALSEFLGTAMAILEGVARQGLKVNKSGGVGARELARYAKQVGTEVTTLRLTLYLAAELHLLTQTGPTSLGTTDEFDEWRRGTPAQRASDLLSAWLPLSLAPTLERDPEGTYLPAFGRGPAHSGLPAGFVLCRLLSTFPGEGAVSVDDMAALLRWYHPMAEIAPSSVPCTWAEGHQLGLFADGALTPLGEAVSTGADEAAVELLEQVLPAPSDQVMFGSDLTIVIPGSPDPAAVDLLDVLATREGHGVVGTWRVSEGSVRGALDSGYAVEDLIEGLRRLAGQDLPQALEYLLRDVARKHGHLHVRPAVAVITSADEPLLAEVVASKSTRVLNLNLVAPTVAVSDRPVEQVLASLRAAGYLPVEMDDDGAPVVQLRRPAGMVAPGEEDAGLTPTEAGGGPGDAGLGSPGDVELDGVDEFDDAAFEAGVAELLASARGEAHQSRPEPDTAAETAARLIAGMPASNGKEPGPGGLEEQIAAAARHLTPAEVHELADAVQGARPVQIRYRTAAGGVSMRVVSELEVLGPHLYGYCHTKADDRTFRLDQILNVAPAMF